MVGLFFFFFLDPFSEQVNLFFSGSGNATVFLIGRALQGRIDMEKKQIFGFNVDSLIGPANQAVSFNASQIKCARLAVDTWTLVYTRLHLI